MVERGRKSSAVPARGEDLTSHPVVHALDEQVRELQLGAAGDRGCIRGTKGGQRDEGNARILESKRGRFVASVGRGDIHERRVDELPAKGGGKLARGPRQS